MTDKTIDSILNETRQFSPSKKFSGEANLSKAELERLINNAHEDHIGFWGRLAEENLHWFKRFTSILNTEKAPNFKWFEDGEINLFLCASFSKENPAFHHDCHPMVQRLQDGDSERETQPPHRKEKLAKAHRI